MNKIDLMDIKKVKIAHSKYLEKEKQAIIAKNRFENILKEE